MASVALGSFACLGAPFLARAADLAQPDPMPGLRLVPSDAPEAAEMSAAYDAGRMVTPALRALPQTEAAVAHVIAWARRTGTGLALRGGGHSFAGHSQHPQLVLDLRDMNRVTPDPATGRVTAGPGALADDAYRALAPLGLTLAGSTWSGVGMAGLTLGGGVGFRARRDGLLCDQLVSLRMVTAEGRVVTASATENPDLFWASRGGGGGQFGVVTDLAYQAAPRAFSHAIDVIVTVPPEEIGPLLYLWQLWSAGNPRHITTHLALFRYSPRSFFVHLTGQSDGDRTALREELRLLLRQSRPLPEDSVQSGSMAEILDQMHPPAAGLTPANFLSRSHMVGDLLPPEAIDALIVTLMAFPAESVKLVFEALGGAVSDIATTATAFVHRKASALIQMTGEIWDENTRSLRRTAMNAVSSVLAPYVTGGAYVNYPDPDLANWQSAYWGENRDRLRRIKTAWDPENLFRHAQSLG